MWMLDVDAEWMRDLTNTYAITNDVILLNILWRHYNSEIV